MSRFLRFTVEETLRGNVRGLKEVVIGIAVFDRDSNYDPRLDPIVRVEARRLRSKLKAYYDGPGRHDTLIIDLPTGHYMPALRCANGPVEAETDAAVDEFTIAVLPFWNLNPEPDSTYFSDGLSEELIHGLTRVPGLRVVAWNSAVQLRMEHDNFQSVRKKLGVNHMLRGSVRRMGDRLRITAQLIGTSNGYYLWSETFDRRVDDLFAIQEEIANAIVTALQPRYQAGANAPPVVAGSRNVEAYTLCSRGRAQARERTVDGLRRSLVLFEQAITLDPASAVAHAGLAEAITLRADYGLVTSSELMPKAKAAAERALELDPRLAEAHASLASILGLFEWRWAESEAAFRRAIELNPGYAAAHHWYGCDCLGFQGRIEEGILEMEKARQLDPLSVIILEGRGFLQLLGRNYERAIEYHSELAAIDPSFYKAYTSLGRACIQLGDYGQAIEHLLRGQELGGEIPNILGALGQAYALDGDTRSAERILGTLEQMAAYKHVPSTCFALIRLGMGQPELALSALERGIEARELPLVALGVHPAYDPLRKEPRFQALIDRLNLAHVRGADGMPILR